MADPSTDCSAASPTPPPAPSANSPTVPIDDTIAIQERTLDRQLEWIRAVDVKTAFVLTICLAMLAGLFALAPKSENLGWKHVAVLVGGGALVVLTAILCGRATFPQRRGPLGSLVFFGEICKHSREGYASAVARRSREEYLADLNAQCHRNAQIAALKYRRVGWAMVWLEVGLVFWLAAMVTLYWGLLDGTP